MTPTDLTVHVLERIQQSISEVGARLDAVELCIDGVDTRLAEHGELLSLGDDRLGSLERSTAQLEQHASATNERLSSLERSTAQLEKHASVTNERLSSVERSTEQLQHHAAATHEVLEIVNTRLGFFERAATVATEACSRLEDHVVSHDARFARVEARVDVLERR